MSNQQKIKGLSLKVGPLGENDRLLTLLTLEEGIIRVAVPGARRPKSSLAATCAFTLLELNIVGKRNLRKVRQIKVLRSYSKLGGKLETLSAGQSITELCMMLVGTNDPNPEILQTVLIHLERLQKIEIEPLEVLANCVQSYVHLLALGGYGLPVQECCRTGTALNPPIGNWDWNCSFIPTEGFAIGEILNTEIKLNASELALLQRLLSPSLPLKKDGSLLGPSNVWMKLLQVIEIWIKSHLHGNLNSLKMLKDCIQIEFCSDD